LHTKGWSSTASKFSGGEKSANVPSVLAQNVLLKRKRLQQPQPPKVARSPMNVANAKIKEEIVPPHYHHHRRRRRRVLLRFGSRHSLIDA
jgi:hypothetical protein